MVRFIFSKCEEYCSSAFLIPPISSGFLLLCFLLIASSSCLPSCWLVDFLVDRQFCVPTVLFRFSFPFVFRNLWVLFLGRFHATWSLKKRWRKLFALLPACCEPWSKSLCVVNFASKRVFHQYLGIIDTLAAYLENNTENTSAKHSLAES